VLKGSWRYLEHDWVATQTFSACGTQIRSSCGIAGATTRSGRIPAGWGCWNLLRVRKSGILSRHRHPGPVHAFVLKGSWRYLEHEVHAAVDLEVGDHLLDALVDHEGVGLARRLEGVGVHQDRDVPPALRRGRPRRRLRRPVRPMTFRPDLLAAR
jgi:hypothetical protein